MDVTEFFAIFSDLGVMGDVLNERDVLISYSKAMQTQIDEINVNKRHMKMNKLEFLEGIARCCDKLSLPPPKGTVEEWTINKRMDQLLVNKIQHFLYFLLKLGSNDFIAKYQWPGRDRWGLFIVPTVTNDEGERKGSSQSRRGSFSRERSPSRDSDNMNNS